MKKALVLASGTGSLFEHLAANLENRSLGTSKVTALITNNPEALVLKKAEKLSISNYCIDTKDYPSLLEWDKALAQKIKELSPDLIVLAGFLKKIDIEVLNLKIPIVNIHPSLLPKYSGKGMYGLNVHKAVIESGDSVTGSTMHWVNADYDGGKIIAHIKVDVSNGDSPLTLQDKVKGVEKDLLLDCVSQILCE